MRLFNNVRKKESSKKEYFNKEEVIKEILETRKEECAGWNLFSISKFRPEDVPENYFDESECDFFAIYTDVINKEIRLSSNPFSEYKRTVESIYQIVREVYITDSPDENKNYPQLYKKITASSAKELFIKLKKEIE